MAKQRNPKPRQDFVLKLPPDLARDLEAYCRSNEDTPRVPVVRKAIRSYIDWRLEADAQLRQRYEVAQRELGRIADLRVIQGAKPE